MVSNKDREVIYSLGAQVRQIADLEEMQLRKKCWHEHNALKSTRPLVLSYPEGSWKELVPESQLQCQGGLLRSWEMDLRRRIYWWQHIHDDNVMEPNFQVRWCVDGDNFGVEKQITRTQKNGSYAWNKPIEDLDADFDEDNMRNDLRKTLDAAGECVLEIIMKDTATVANEPDRISKWVKMALEEVDKFFS